MEEYLHPVNEEDHSRRRSHINQMQIAQRGLVVVVAVVDFALLLW